MAIEITQFTKVNIAVSPQGEAAGDFGILGFLTDEVSASNPITSAERYRSYTSLKSVGTDWATSSEVYKAATAFYSATPTPTEFVVLMQYKSFQAAKILGGTHLPFAELVTTTGDLTINVDGSDVTVQSLDFSGEIDMAGIVVKLNSEFNNELVFSYDDNAKRIMMKSQGSAVGTSLIEFPEGDMAEALGLTQWQGTHAYASPAETVVDALNQNVQTAVEFTGLVLNKQYRDNTTEPTALGGDSIVPAVAAWADASNKIFCNTTNNLGVLQSSVTSDIASVLQGAGHTNTLTTFSRYPSLYPSAAVFGRASTVNFGATASTITLNLKQLSGVIGEDLTPSQYASLKDKNASAVIKIGKSVSAYSDSRMSNGGFFDSVHGLMWLKNRIEVDMFNLLYRTTTKIPYTQTGINIVKSTLERSLQAAVRNGLSASGYTPLGKYLPDGFEVTAIPLASVPTDDKTNRIYQGISFEMVGSGALHGVVISGTFSE